MQCKTVIFGVLSYICLHSGKNDVTNSLCSQQLINKLIHMKHLILCWREGGSEGGREGGRERGREGGREGGRDWHHTRVRWLTKLPIANLRFCSFS